MESLEQKAKHLQFNLLTFIKSYHSLIPYDKYTQQQSNTSKAQ